jgi:hypothetical protein
MREDARGVSTVLLVVADRDEREAFGSGLEAAGFEVLSCPGPTEPDYTCVGAREGVCPLVRDADAIVLDMTARRSCREPPLRSCSPCTSAASGR